MSKKLSKIKREITHHYVHESNRPKLGTDVPNFRRDILGNPKYRFRGNLLDINSSNISKAGYYHWFEMDTLVMRIVFLNGRVYDCFPVSRELWDGFLLSESKGKYYNDFIKSNPSITIEEQLDD